MKKSKIIVFLVLATLSISLNSCKKEKPEPTKSELIVGKWTWEKTENFENGQLSQSTTKGTKVEFKDNHDLVFFDANGNVDNSAQYSTWELNSDEDELTWKSASNQEMLFDVDTLTESNLVISRTTINGATTSKMVFTMSK